MSFKEVSFAPISKAAEQVVPRPEPAGKVMPQWWKDTPAFKNGGAPKYAFDGSVDASMKLCVPFADTFRFGYIQKTWQEIRINPLFDGEEFEYNFPTSPEIVTMRDETYLPESYFQGHYPVELEWKSQWIPKLPKGYSALITHPLNRHDLPFTTLTGIVDSDSFWHENEANHPFMVKKGFEGIIPIGTPMFQIIPFKRDDWESVQEEYDPNSRFNVNKVRAMFYGGYKNMFWKKKTFK